MSTCKTRERYRESLSRKCETVLHPCAAQVAALLVVSVSAAFLILWYRDSQKRAANRKAIETNGASPTARDLELTEPETKPAATAASEEDRDPARTMV